MSLGKASMSLLDFPRNAAKGCSCKENGGQGGGDGAL